MTNSQDNDLLISNELVSQNKGKFPQSNDFHFYDNDLRDLFFVTLAGIAFHKLLKSC